MMEQACRQDTQEFLLVVVLLVMRSNLGDLAPSSPRDCVCSLPLSRLPLFLPALPLCAVSLGDGITLALMHLIAVVSALD